MKTAPARATKRADQPPSTPGTPARRARRWPVLVSILALGLVAVAAQAVAADPASAPAQKPVKAAAPAKPATAAKPVRQKALKKSTAFGRLGDITVLSAVTASNKVSALQVTPPPPPPPPPVKKVAPPVTRQAPAAGPSTGRCGGDLPPCYIMNRESGGSLTAKNPSSSASGKWQFLDSTWAGYGGYSSASQAPESVQDAKARQLWAGGSGCGHWSAC
ncbi:transglycosylase family protein [Aquihabitans sp. McL0605]|uniref:transglycosylase family protein n=1 Tax=Aquihabitans sp. McL0605 TaxID=3415671 RepID=UPI003CF18F5B